MNYDSIFHIFFACLKLEYELEDTLPNRSEFINGLQKPNRMESMVHNGELITYSTQSGRKQIPYVGQYS